MKSEPPSTNVSTIGTTPEIQIRPKTVHASSYLRGRTSTAHPWKCRRFQVSESPFPAKSGRLGPRTPQTRLGSGASSFESAWRLCGFLAQLRLCRVLGEPRGVRLGQGP